MAHAFYQVERLIHYRRKDGHFLVKWVGYPVSDNTWEHKDSLPDELVFAWLGIIHAPHTPKCIRSDEAKHEQQAQENGRRATTHAKTARSPENFTRKAAGKRFWCSWARCEKSYRCADSLKKHTRFHTGKVFACPWEECAYKALSLSTLSIHSRVHTGEKPFICPQVGCGYSSSEQGNLNKHMRKRHQR
jgi:uncharacterized Zn-finger protein